MTKSQTIPSNWPGLTLFVDLADLEYEVLELDEGSGGRGGASLLLWSVQWLF